MPKASPIQSSFNAGQISPRLEGRTDIDKYRSGCKTLENYIPLVGGAAMKRSGTRFVREVKDSSAKTRLIPFQFNTEQSYILEFGNLYIRFYTLSGILLDSGSPYEIVTPYTTADIDNIQFTQSADVMYLAHMSHAPRKLSRLAATSWTLTEIDFVWPPFQQENISTTTVYVGADTGTTTATASASIFTSDMVGGHLKLREIIASVNDEWATGVAITTGDVRYYDGNVYVAASTANTGTRPPVHDSGTVSDGGVDWTFQNDGKGYAKITGYTSATVVSIEVPADIKLPKSVVGSGNATTRWSLGKWADEYGYPKSVNFFEDRLLWAANTAFPQNLWGSKSGDYENHKSGTNDDDAIDYTINSDQVNVIQWISPGKVLVIGTAGGEFVMSASSREEAVTPTNVRIVRQTNYGSKEIAPVRIGSTVLFVQRSGEKLREYVYQFDTDSYDAPDLTILAENITYGGISQMSYQQEPNRLLWLVRSDGALVCMSYERPENVIAWHDHPVGGGGTVESIASIPHPDGDSDQLWMIVNRTINSSTKRYVEILQKDWRSSDTASSAFFVDSGLSYSGASTTTISGLDHLEGETVSVLADGATHPDKVVASGSITLDRSASVAQVGLSYNATLQTMRMDYGAADGTSQGKTKRLTNISFMLYQTGPGLHFGPSLTDLDELHFRDSNMAMDSPVDIFDGIKGPLPWPGGYEQDAYVFIRHQLPLPCTILAIMPQMVTQDR